MKNMTGLQICLIISTILLLVIGYLYLFRTEKVQQYYVKMHNKAPGKLSKMRFYKSVEEPSFIFHLRLIGVVLLVFAVLMVWIIIKLNIN